MSSIHVVDLVGRLSEQSALSLSPALVYERASLEDLSQTVLQKMALGGGTIGGMVAGVNDTASDRHASLLDATDALGKMLLNIQAERTQLQQTMSSVYTSPAAGFYGPTTARPAPRYALIGGGGHAAEVVMAITLDARAEIAGIYDDNTANHGSLVEGVLIRGGSADPPEDASWLICIGQNEVRKKIAEKIGIRANSGVPFWPAVASRVSESASVGAGTFIAADVRVGPRARIGRHCIINPGALIGHDAIVSDYAFVGAHAVLGGNAQVCEGAVLGMGAVIAPGRKLSEWSTAMIGSAVVADVPANMACAGVPAIVTGPSQKTRVA